MTVLVWVAALPLALGLGIGPVASADEPDPETAAATAASSPTEKPDPAAPEEAPKSAEKPAAEQPSPSAEQPSPSAEAPEPSSEPEPKPPSEPPEEAPPPAGPSGAQQVPPPTADSGDTGPGGSAKGTPTAPTPLESPAAGSADPLSPSIPDPAGPADPESEPVGLDESLAGHEIEPMSIALDDVCAIGSDGYPTLDAAIAAATSGQTITVLKSFTHTSPVVISGMDLTFDLSEGSITIDTRASTNSYALMLKNAHVTLSGGGYLDVKGDLRGVHATNASITVRYATADWGTGAYAEGGGKITVRGDATGYVIGAFAHGAGSTVTVDDDAIANGHSARGAEAMAGGRVTAKNALSSGIDSIGAAASSSGTVAIAQEARGTAVGAKATGGQITVGGKVTASGSDGIGAWAQDGGSITIDGELTGATYVRVGEVAKQANQSEPLTTLVGYRTYADGANTVWVKGAPLAENVCAIGDQEFPSLDDALAAADGTADAPTVIRLLRSISHSETLVVGGRHVVFDLNGFRLSIYADGSKGLTLDGGSVGYLSSNSYDFAIFAGERAVEVLGGGKATVGYIGINDRDSFGVYAAGEGSRITVNGVITTGGGHYARAIGAYAVGGGEVVVGQFINLWGDYTHGAMADAGGRVVVQGWVMLDEGVFAVGENPRYGGEVVVDGQVYVTGSDGTGVKALGGIARVSGIVQTWGERSIGVESSDDGEVLIDGEVNAFGSQSRGVYAHVGEGSGGSVHVTGQVKVTGDDSLGAEVYSRGARSSNSQVTIDGQLTAPEYLLVDNVARAIDSKDSTETTGHWLYLGPNGSLVKIRNGQPQVTPDPTEPPASPDPTDPPASPDPTDPPASPDPTDPPASPEPIDPPASPDPSEIPDPTPAPSDRETDETASSPSDSEELPVTGAGEAQLGLLLGLTAVTLLGGLGILFLNGSALRRRE